MKKVLFLPFLHFSSGHHQAADAIAAYLEDYSTEEIVCYKKDIFSYSYKRLEALVSAIYLKWIHYSPTFYNHIYEKNAFDVKKSKLILYEWLFERYLHEITKKYNPDLIVCTHALPSYLISNLKQKGMIKASVINVYTDFFIHNIWGTKQVDYHFVSTDRMTEFLLAKGVKKDSIFRTGIPIHYQIKSSQPKLNIKNQYDLLVTGGNLGVGAIEKFLKIAKHTSKFRFHVLCGKNESLYKKLVEEQSSNIIPLPYIDSRIEMNKLYDKMDGIITKPGGITVTEALYKGLPIFVYHYLPGQEQINFNELKELGMIYSLTNWQTVEHIEQTLLNTLSSPNKQPMHIEPTIQFHHATRNQRWEDLVREALNS